MSIFRLARKTREREPEAEVVEMAAYPFWTEVARPTG
jgi:hypothetical protein